MRDLRTIIEMWRHGRQEYPHSDLEATRGRFRIRIPGMPSKNVGLRYAMTHIYESKEWHLVRLTIREKNAKSNNFRFRIPTMAEIFKIRAMVFEPDDDVFSYIDYTYGREHLDTKHFNLWQNKTQTQLPIPKSYTLYTPTMTLETYET